MANNGLLQAKIVYKIALPSGAALDINGNLTSVSGLKQAIFLLTGESNPNPALYDVAGYFTENGLVSGTPTSKLSDLCPAGDFIVSPMNIVILATYSAKTLPAADWLAQDWDGGATVGFSWLDTRCIVGAEESLTGVKVHAHTAGTIRVELRKVSDLSLSYYMDLEATVGENIVAITYEAAVAHYVTVQGIDAEMSIKLTGGNPFGRYVSGSTTAAAEYPFGYTIAVNTINNRSVTLDIVAFNPWEVVSASPFLDVSPLEGGIGTSVAGVTVNQLDENGTVVLRSGTITRTVNILMVASMDWVLDGGFWNMAGFWFDDEIFNF